MSEERINELKEKVAGLQEELKELTPEELEQVAGGAMGPNVAGVIGSAVAAGTLLEMYDV